MDVSNRCGQRVNQMKPQQLKSGSLAGDFNPSRN